MKRSVFICALVVLGTTGCKLFKHSSKENNKNVGQAGPYVPPNDGIARTYHATMVAHPDTVRLGGGIKYILIAKGDGPAMSCGDKPKMTYVGKLMNDTVFDATYLHGNNPFSFELCKHQVIAGWDSVVSHLHCGDVAQMWLPAKMAYGARQMGKIPANADLKFLVEVIDVAAKPKPWDAAGKDTITTASGLKVVIFESHPEAAKPDNGSMVTLNYSGFLADGSLFDSSIPRGQPFTFKLGAGQVIKGWDEGVAMLHKGEKAKFIIPYTLGYGEGGYPCVIPPKATLIFDVQLMDIK